MPHLDAGLQPITLVINATQLLRVCFLQATGAREHACAYCTSILPMGDHQCAACGAKRTASSPNLEDKEPTKGNWIVPLLICLFFPPAALLVAPALLWRTPGKRIVPT